MTHKMKLNAAPFELIKRGSKTIELRLFDEKRRKIGVGDVIVFTNTSDMEQKTSVRVKRLLKYGSFEELFSSGIDLLQCGYDAGVSVQDAVEGMREYYSEEMEREQGVLGIVIEVIA